MIQIKKIQSDQIKEAEAFYVSVGYDILIQPDDYVIAAYDDQKIVGIVRLSFDQHTITLRGMMIAPAYQRQGIGTRLLKELDPIIGTKTCWCLPHSWLTKFYGQIGFRVVDERQAPSFLQERLKLGRLKHPQMIVMVKNGNH